MKKERRSTISGNLHMTHRMPNSINGNARFRLHVHVGGQPRIFYTATDSAVSDRVKEITHSNGSWESDDLRGVPVAITFDGRGSVRGIEREA